MTVCKLDYERSINKIVVYEEKKFFIFLYICMTHYTYEDITRNWRKKAVINNLSY